MTTNPTALMEKDANGLLPCPFCGGIAKLHNDWDGCWSIVQCTQCWIVGTGNRNKDYKAVDQWNTRHPDPSLLTALSMQREALEHAFEIIEALDDDALGIGGYLRDGGTRWYVRAELLANIKQALTATLNLTGDEDGK